MTINNIIKSVMKSSKTTAEEMARRTGAKSGKTITRRLLNENMEISGVLQYLDALGYEMTIQPKKQGRRASGQILVSVE